jgi:hypothetical protein
LEKHGKKGALMVLEEEFQSLMKCVILKEGQVNFTYITEDDLDKHKMSENEKNDIRRLLRNCDQTTQCVTGVFFETMHSFMVRTISAIKIL